ncbi:MAG: glycosyltransferase family 4 protein [Chlorobi bacterium]|nr:glycosyltransferase family 4 protein [Chlorobiota bacterium]
MANGFALKGHEVSVITRACDSKERYEHVNNVHYHFINSDKKMNIKAGWRFGNIIFSYEMVRAIDRISKRRPVDVIECPDYLAQGLWGTYTHNDRLIIRLHTPEFLGDMLNERKPDMQNRFDYLCEKKALSRARYVTSVSDSLLGKVRGFSKIRAKKIAILPNPIDSSFFSPGGPVKSDYPTILYFGRIELRKGVHILAHAAMKVLKKRPNVRFVFVGSDTSSAPDGGSMLEYVKGIVFGQDNVIFTGYMEMVDLVKQIQGSTICALPSSWEAFGYTVLEAMACGKPVIATANGGFKEIIKNGETGVLVPPNDSDALAAAIIKTLDSDFDMERFGGNARKEVESVYSLDVLTDRFCSLYQEWFNL